MLSFLFSIFIRYSFFNLPYIKKIRSLIINKYLGTERVVIGNKVSFSCSHVGGVRNWRFQMMS